MEALELLANVGHDPALFYHGPPWYLYDADVACSMPHITMAVMELVEGKTVPCSVQLSQEQFLQLSNAVNIMHQAGYVHGKVRLLDPDWAKVGGFAYYSENVYMVMRWPNGAKPFQSITVSTMSLCYAPSSTEVEYLTIWVITKRLFVAFHCL